LCQGPRQTAVKRSGPATEIPRLRQPRRLSRRRGLVRAFARPRGHGGSRSAFPRQRQCGGIEAATAMNHVFYYNYYGRPVFAETLREHGITLTELRPDATEAEADAVIGRSHTYQISSGVNDMPAHYQARAPLLDRAPNLLVVSAVGAGFDTIDVAACTERGILAINQSGGANAQAVVEHTLAMRLDRKSVG